MKTGLLIKELRTKKGLTQEKLAEKTELSTRTIQRIENGDVDPRAYTLQMIANALDVDFSLFMESTPNESPENKKSSNNKWLGLLHLSGILPLIFPTLIVWNYKIEKTKVTSNHFRAVIILQLIILIISLISLWIYFHSIQPRPLFGGLLAGGSLSIMNAIRVMNGASFINPLVKNEGQKN